MFIAYCCILVAALLPYVWVLIAKTGAPGYNNKDPRGWIAKQESYRVRNAYAAHLNAFEAFAPFAAAVLMAQLASVDAQRISILAVAFVACRILHGVFYIAVMQAPRSLAWFGGFVCMLALMGSAVFAQLG